MINVHPPLTNFPIVFLLSALAAECLSRWWKPTESRSFARCCFALAVVSTCLCYLSGYSALWFAQGSFNVPEAVIATHQTSAKILLFALVPTVILFLTGVDENSVKRTAYLAALWICVMLLVVTAHQGATLVFTHGAGVTIHTAE